MSRYFEVVYPERLKELKSKLDSIAVQFDLLAKIGMAENAEMERKILNIFVKTFNYFLNETRLHITFHKKSLDMSEAKFISRQYLLDYFKDTPTGTLLKILYEEKDGHGSGKETRNV